MRPTRNFTSPCTNASVVRGRVSASERTSSMVTTCSEPEADVREVPRGRRRPQGDEHREERPAHERQRPTWMVAVVHEEDLHDDDAVDERAEDRMDQDARRHRLEPEDEDAVERN